MLHLYHYIVLHIWICSCCGPLGLQMLLQSRCRVSGPFSRPTAPPVVRLTQQHSTSPGRSTQTHTPSARSTPAILVLRSCPSLLTSGFLVRNHTALNKSSTHYNWVPLHGLMSGRSCRHLYQTDRKCIWSILHSLHLSSISKLRQAEQRVPLKCPVLQMASDSCCVLSGTLATASSGCSMGMTTLCSSWTTP